MYNCPSDQISLKPNAIPTLIDVPNPHKLLTPKRKPRSRVTSDEIKESKKRMREMPPPSIDETDRIPTTSKAVTSDTIEEAVTYDTQSLAHDCVYKRRYSKARIPILRLHGKIRRMQKKITRTTVKTTVKSKAESSSPKKVHLNATAERFILSQHEYFSRSKRGMRWTDGDKKLTIAIFYKSPSTYKYLRTIFALPSESVIYEGLRQTMETAGICERTLLGLKLKTEGMDPVERCCLITIDGMKVNPCLQYMKDDIVRGYEELGGGQRTNNTATGLSGCHYALRINRKMEAGTNL